MNDKYVIVSSDCHAGPPADHYREYMDPQYRDTYDEFLAGLAALSELPGSMTNAQKAFREKFLAKTGDGGNQASWDPVARERELDHDGVAGEVIFPDADVLGIGGVTSSPFGVGLGASGRDDPRARPWPGPGPTTAGWPICARPAPGGGPASPPCP